MALYYYDNDSVSSEQMEKFGCTEMSPALNYVAVDSMEDILNEIARGVIPTNTGEPFPVVWKNDNNYNINSGYTSPEKPNFAGNSGFINPASNLIKL